MHLRATILLLAAGFVVCAACGPARADAQADFEKLFGAEVRKALASPDPRDDADLAGSLLKAAQASVSSPDLLAVLCEKAYELGSRNAAGCRAAVDAMRLLAEKAPEREVACREKALAACQLLFARATGPAKQKAGEELLATMVDLADDKVDARKSTEASALYQKATQIAAFVRSDRASEIQTKLREAQSRQRIDQRHDALKTRLEKDSQDAEARNALIVLCVVEYDDLPAAQKLLNQDVDETVRTYLPMAAKPLDETAEAGCLELAEWFRKLDVEASLRGRFNILTRARNYYSRFIESHTQSDASLLLARKGLAEVEEALKAVEEKLAGPDGGLSGLLRDVKVISQGHNVGDRMMIMYKGKVLMDATTGESTTGLTMVTVRNGAASAPVTFNTCANRRASEQFADAVAAIPAGTLVVLAVRHDGATSFTQRGQEAIRSIGGKIGLLNQPHLNSYFCIGRKGMAPGQAVERNSNRALAYPPDLVPPKPAAPAGDERPRPPRPPERPDRDRPRPRG